MVLGTYVFGVVGRGHKKDLQRSFSLLFFLPCYICLFIFGFMYVRMHSCTARTIFFSPPVALLSFISRFALVRQQIGSITTGSHKKIWDGNGRNFCCCRLHLLHLKVSHYIFSVVESLYTYIPLQMSSLFTARFPSRFYSANPVVIESNCYCITQTNWKTKAIRVDGRKIFDGHCQL